MRRTALLTAFGAALLQGAEPPAAMEHARRSYSLAQGGDLRSASAAMRAAIAAAPDNPLYWTALGGLLSRQGDTAEAKACFARAVALDPANPVYRYQLATRQWESGELEQAHANLVLIAGTGPVGAQPMLEAVSLDWGAVLARQGRWRAGLTVAHDTAQRFPASARARQMLGLFQTRNSQNVAAAESYAHALRLAPDSPDCSVGLGIAQSLAGMPAEAERTFTQGLARWPQDAPHHQAYGVLLLRLGEVDGTSSARGLAMLRRALELDPHLAEARYRLGNYALEQGDAAAAILHLESAARDGAAPSKVHYALARAYRRTGQEQRAAEQLALFEARKRQEQEALAR